MMLLPHLHLPAAPNRWRLWNEMHETKKDSGAEDVCDWLPK